MTRIVQLTDLHLFSDPAGQLLGIPTRDTLTEVLDHVRAHAGAVDLLVVTGDHTHDELPESYAAVGLLLAPWRDRLWQVPGNHDDRARLRAAFADRIDGAGAEPVRFAVRVGAWLCLGLDTQVPGEVPGRFDDEQRQWLRSRLAEHPGAPTIVFLHHPPVLLQSPWLDRIGLVVGRELLAAEIVSEPRIRLVVGGHVHHETTRALGHATVVTTPSTGVQLDPRGETTAVATDPPGYRVIDLDGDRWTTEVVRLPRARFTPVAP